MLCTDAPTIGSGWRLYGMVFYGRRGLACDPCLVFKTTDGKGQPQAQRAAGTARRTMCRTYRTALEAT
eukprot:2738600-Prymnesium_polylepis.2